MVKLIVTDVDDTLVPEAGSVINSEYYDIIRECRKRGIIFGVASGRQKPCVRKLFEPVLDEIFILADNGTDIWSSQYQTSMKLPYDLYTELIDDIHEWKAILLWRVSQTLLISNMVMKSILNI